MISIIDTSIGENEDDSVLSVGNLGASVARSGWSGYKSLPSNNGGMDVDNDEEVDTPKLGLPDVWAVSDMQTLATFNTDGVSNLGRRSLAFSLAGEISQGDLLSFFLVPYFLSSISFPSSSTRFSLQSMLEDLLAFSLLGLQIMSLTLLIPNP